MCSEDPAYRTNTSLSHPHSVPVARHAQFWADHFVPAGGADIGNVRLRSRTVRRLMVRTEAKCHTVLLSWHCPFKLLDILLCHEKILRETSV